MSGHPALQAHLRKTSGSSAGYQQRDDIGDDGFDDEYGGAHNERAQGNWDTLRGSVGGAGPRPDGWEQMWRYIKARKKVQAQESMRDTQRRIAEGTETPKEKNARMLASAAVRKLAANPAAAARKKQKGRGVDLANAAAGGRFADVVVRLEEGAPIDNRELAGHTPLHYAASCGFVDIAQYLVWSELGERQRLRDGYVARLEAAAGADGADFTAVAVPWGDGGGVGDDFELPRCHAEIDAQNDKYGSTALHLACSVDSEECRQVVQFLLEAGASILIRSKNGMVPLQTALSAMGPDQARGATSARVIGGYHEQPGGGMVAAAAAAATTSGASTVEMLIAAHRELGAPLPPALNAQMAEAYRRLGVEPPAASSGGGGGGGAHSDGVAAIAGGRRRAGGMGGDLASSSAAATINGTADLAAAGGRTAPLNRSLPRGGHSHQHPPMGGGIGGIGGIGGGAHLSAAAAVAAHGPRVPVGALSCPQVCAALEHIGMGRYRGAFSSHEVDGRTLLQCTEGDLDRELGMDLRPKRRALLEQRERWEHEGGVPASVLGELARHHLEAPNTSAGGGGYGAAGGARGAAAGANRAAGRHAEDELYAFMGRRATGAVKGQSEPALYWALGRGEDRPTAQEGQTILEQLKELLKHRGAEGILGLGRHFKLMDANRDGSLDKDEFAQCLAKCQLPLRQKEVHKLFLFFDKDGSGGVSYDEFIVGVRGELNRRRKAVVHLAFDQLDSEREGVLYMDKLARGKIDSAERSRFWRNFSAHAEEDGRITRGDWDGYFACLSASIDDDESFELSVRNAWHISGGAGAAANSTNARVLVTHADGHETVEEVRHDLGVARGGYGAALQRQGVEGKINSKGLGRQDARKDSRGNVLTDASVSEAYQRRQKPQRQGERVFPKKNRTALESSLKKW